MNYFLSKMAVTIVSFLLITYTANAAIQQPRLFIFAVNVNHFQNNSGLGSTEKAVVHLLPSLEIYAARSGIKAQDTYYRIFDQSAEGKVRGRDDPIYKDLNLPADIIVDPRIQFMQPTHEAIDSSIRKLRGELRPSDTVIFYISTHGADNRGLPHLAMSGFDPYRPGLKSIGFEFLYDALNTPTLGKLIYFLDLCQIEGSGPLKADGKEFASAIPNLIKRSEDAGATNVMVVSSTDSGSPSYIDVRNNSTGDGIGFFTLALAKLLVKPGPENSKLHFTNLVDMISGEMKHKDQKPQLWNTDKASRYVYGEPLGLNVALIHLESNSAFKRLNDQTLEAAQKFLYGKVGLESHLSNKFTGESSVTTLLEDDFKLVAADYDGIRKDASRLQGQPPNQRFTSALKRSAKSLKTSLMNLRQDLHNKDLRKSKFDYVIFLWLESKKEKNNYALKWMWFDLTQNGVLGIRWKLNEIQFTNLQEKLDENDADKVAEIFRMDTGEIQHRSVFVSCYSFLGSKQVDDETLIGKLPLQIAWELKARGMAYVHNFSDKEAYREKCSDFKFLDPNITMPIASKSAKQRYILHGDIKDNLIVQKMYKSNKYSGNSINFGGVNGVTEEYGWNGINPSSKLTSIHKMAWNAVNHILNLQKTKQASK